MNIHNEGIKKKQGIIDTSDNELKYKRVDGSSYVFIEEIKEWALNLNDPYTYETYHSVDDIHGSPDDTVTTRGKDDVFRWLDEN